MVPWPIEITQPLAQFPSEEFLNITAEQRVAGAGHGSCQSPLLSSLPAVLPVHSNT